MTTTLNQFQVAIANKSQKRGISQIEKLTNSGLFRIKKEGRVVSYHGFMKGLYRTEGADAAYWSESENTWKKCEGATNLAFEKTIKAIEEFTNANL